MLSNWRLIVDRLKVTVNGWKLNVFAGCLIMDGIAE